MAYDISDARRLRHVAKVMEAYGDRLQYSVFLCDLSGMERVGWEADIRDELNLAEDSVVCIDLGPVGVSAPVVTFGVSRRLPASGATVV